jgi:YD repeat-containing protein
VAPNADGSFSLSLTATGRLMRTESRMADGTLLHASSNRYDAANRLLCTMDANGVINSNSYDAADRVIATTIYAPGLPPQTTRQTYDQMGRTATVIQPDGGVVLMGRNGLTLPLPSAGEDILVRCQARWQPSPSPAGRLLGTRPAQVP